MLYDIVSFETGEIFAEGLCGEGSVGRWIRSRGLTFHSMETEEEWKQSEAARVAYLEEFEEKLGTHPEHAEGIIREIERYSIESVRYVYVKESRVKKVEFPVRAWHPPIRDEDGDILDEGFWYNQFYEMTTAFVD